MLEVLEHIEDAIGVLAALADHMTLKGQFLVTVPAYPFLWSPHDENCLHFRRCTRETLAVTVAAAA